MRIWVGAAIVRSMKKSCCLSSKRNKVFIRGQWIDMSSMTLGKLLKTPEYDKGEYSQMME